MPKRQHSNTPVEPSLSELQDYSSEQLNTLFAQLQAPAADELVGTYSGQVLAVAGLERLPKFVRELVQMAAEAVWKGKSFVSDSGSNEWVKAPGGLSLISYQTYLADSEGAGQVLALDYDIAGNPAPLKRIYGEVKRLSPSVYFARMRYRLGEKGIPILYFTLSK